MVEKFYIGIDPGSKGAISILNQDSEVVLMEDMPFLNKEKILDMYALRDILAPYMEKNHFCVLEKCQYTPAIRGSGAFTFGKTIGYTEAFLVMLGVHHELITPQKWKKEFSLIGKDKQASIALAKRMYPNVEDKLLKTKDGRAESLLIATYCKRCNSGD